MWALIQNRRIKRLATLEVGQEQTAALSNRTNGLELGSPAADGNGCIWVRIRDETDQLDPKNWTLLSRFKNIVILSLLIFAQAWAGSADSQANERASREFGVSQTAENLSTAMYLFGISSGSLFAGPFSESIGRNPTYLVSTLMFLLFVLGSARTRTFAGQVICRYFVGLSSSATLSINGSSVGDQFRPVKRAFVFPMIAWANIAGPTISPIVGGWVVSNPDLDWRWTEYITLIISAFTWVVALLFLPETYLPILLDWKSRQVRRETGDERYACGPTSSLYQRLKDIVPLPIIFFSTEPVISVLGAYLVLLYCILFTFLSGFDYIFKRTYNMSIAQTGSCFGAIAAGATVATFAAPGLYKWARRKTHYEHGAALPPEFRLWPAIIASPFLPISLFWLGWTNSPTVSVWSSLLACGLFGAVLISIYISSYEYIIDSYGKHAASALASITMVRYLIAGGMVLAARPMYERIGVHWTMTILGSISLLLAPMPLLFKIYGTRLRKRSRYAESPTAGPD
ncbi:unnamed protein product [Penicillium egyptiacum]|uniref:Major facilitator superfamily (MFS) profile domain-containing protein n=1 Tax=Penicillium egyptiacum TaxID=1303716 RepID=A0A9W4KDB9_9EURO|nr:unnamed protein product [Penicillium egyptiacum]